MEEFFDRDSGNINKEGVRKHASETLKNAHSRISEKLRALRGGETLRTILNSKTPEEQETISQSLDAVDGIGAHALEWEKDNYAADEGSPDSSAAFDKQIVTKALEYSQTRNAPEAQNYSDALGNRHDQAVGVSEFFDDFAKRVEGLKEIGEEDKRQEAYHLWEKVNNHSEEFKTLEGRQSLLENPDSNVTAEDIKAILDAGLIIGADTEPTVSRDRFLSPDGTINQEEWNKAVFEAASGILEDRLIEEINQLADTDTAREIYERAEDVYRRRTGTAGAPESAPVESPVESPPPTETPPPAEPPTSTEPGTEGGDGNEGDEGDAGGPPAGGEGGDGERIPEEGLVNKAKDEMNLMAERYILAKRRSRSFWGNLGSNLAAAARNLVRRPDVAGGDDAVRQTRLSYETARNRYLALRTQREVNQAVTESTTDAQRTAYRERVAENVVRFLVEEMSSFSQRELALINPQNAVAKALGRVYSNPWARTAIGLGLNFGILASTAMGALPVSAALAFVARGGFGTIGAEGGLHGIQNIYSGNLGARRTLERSEIIDRADGEGPNGTEDIRRRMASFYEERMRTRQARVSETENRLIAEYQTRITRQIQELISTPGEGQITGNRDEQTAALLMAALKVENANTSKDQALQFARRAGATRWAVAAGLAGAGTLLTTDWRPGGATGGGVPGGGGEAIGPPGLSSTETMTFTGPDPHYGDVLHNPDVSSLWAWSQARVAENAMGIQSFDWSDPDKLSKFNELWNGPEHGKYASMAGRLNDTVRNMNQGVISGDLIPHNRAITIPRNLAGILR